MDSYQIRWRASTRKDLRRIATSEIDRILSAVKSLGMNPLPAGCVKLSGSDASYRIRVGDYKVIYEIINDLLIVEVIRIAHRHYVYR
jgi:mRNA interferase RelE/StbE